VLDELTALLRSHGEEHWSYWLERDAELIRHGDRGGVEHLLSAYGGMGSLNDIYLCPENGSRILARDVGTVNQQLQGLLSEAFRLASAHRGSPRPH